MTSTIPIFFYCIYANALGRCTLIVVKRDFANDRIADAFNLPTNKGTSAYLTATYRKAFTYDLRTARPSEKKTPDFVLFPFACDLAYLDM